MKKLLVVVDMQNDFVTGVLGTKEAQKIVPEVVRLAEGFDGDIIFTRDTHKANYEHTLEGKRLPVRHCIKGTDGWRIIPELKDVLKRCLSVVDKPAFGSMHLAQIVQNGDYDEITLCGLCTDICVISNALLLKTALPNTPVAVVKKCCAGVTPQSHENALNAMAACQVDII